MNNEIIEFIKRRFPDNNGNWLNGNCYWFAKILVERFPELDIYYEPIVGHFYAGKDREWYDWTGLARPYRFPELLSKIEKSDPLWYERIVRDCIL